MDGYGYGLWVLVFVNSAVFILFALSFFHPANRRDWRALGGFSAFIVALFAKAWRAALALAAYFGLRRAVGTRLRDKLILQKAAAYFVRETDRR